MAAEYLAVAAEKGWEVYCCIVLLRSFVQTGREQSRRMQAAGGCILVVVGLAADAIFQDVYCRAAAVCLFVSYFMLVTFRIRYVMALVLSLLYYGLTIVTEYMAAVMVAAVLWCIPGNPQGIFMPLLSGDVIFVLVSKALLWGVIVMLGRMSGRGSLDVLTDREWWLLFFSSLCTVVSFLIISGVPVYLLQQDTGAGRSFLFLAVGILFIDLVVYRLTIEVTKREQKRREDAVFREKVKSEMAMYRSMAENLDRQKKRAHEYKNQMTAISALAAEKKYEELQAYLEKIGNSMLTGTGSIDTGNVIVNAILNTKYQEAVAAGIVFVLKINNLSRLNIQEDDIVILLSNLLGNAFEACGQSEKTGRIRLKFVQEDERVILSVQNSLQTEPIVENGLFLTTKTADDGGEHGFGIRNVIETVEKYHGKYVIDHDRSSFRFSILIPNPK